MGKMILKKIGTMSAAKIGAIFYGIIGLLIALCMVVVGAATIITGGSAASAAGMIAIGIAVAIGYTIIGVVAIAISVLIFNFITGIAGGLELEMQ